MTAPPSLAPRTAASSSSGTDRAPAGGEFRVNTYTTGGINGYPSIALIPISGDFIIVWSGSGSGDVNGVFAQRFDQTGDPVGGEFRVNTETTGVQHEVSVAVQPSAGVSALYVVVWEDNSSSKVLGQRYSLSHGTFGPSGSEFVIADGLAPRVTMDSSGDFLVTWLTVGVLNDVMGRFFDAPGVPLGSEFRINTYTTNLQRTQAVATLSAGKHVVVWESLSQDGSDLGVFGQRFNRNGDVNGDNVISVLDVFYLISFLFAGGTPPLGPANVNGDVAGVDVLDVFYLINFLFAGGGAPV
jgi:large repetitive protein